MKILIETFNGQDYSSPKIIVNPTPEQVIEVISYYLADFTSFEMKIESNKDIQFDDCKDQSRIQIADIPDNKFTIIQITPDVNEFELQQSFDTLKEAKECFHKSILGWSYTEKSDEFEEYKEGDISFGWHSDTDLGYIYLEIIEGK